MLSVIAAWLEMTLAVVNNASVAKGFMRLVVGVAWEFVCCFKKPLLARDPFLAIQQFRLWSIWVSISIQKFLSGNFVTS
jgi:hypothetical protein